jgi:hypothetical protein
LAPYLTRQLVDQAGDCKSQREADALMAVAPMETAERP